MYGTRDADWNWEHDPACLHRRSGQIRVVVHGDDFTVLGSEVELDWFRERISERFEVKFRARLGPQERDNKSVRLLYIVIEWGSEGIRYEADQRHAELVIRDMGLDQR